MIFYNIGECCRQKTKQALGLRSVVYVDVTSGAGGRGRRGVGTSRQVRARRPLILNTHTAAHLNMFYYKYSKYAHMRTALRSPLLRKFRFSNKKALGFVTMIWRRPRNLKKKQE